MSLRVRLFPVLVAVCTSALALLSVTQHLRAMKATEESLRADTEWRARRFAQALEAELRTREDDLNRLASAPAWIDTYRTAARDLHAEPPVTDEARAGVGAYLAAQRGLCSALTFVYGTEGRPLMRFEPSGTEGGGVRVVPGALLPSRVELGEQRLVPGARQERVALAPMGGIILVAPVPLGEEERPESFAALVAEIKPDALAARAAEGLAGGAGVPRQALALEPHGRIVYHTNDALRFQSVTAAMPYFSAVAAEMDAGRSGAMSFDGTDGARWLAAYAPVPGLDLSVAVTANAGAALGEVRRAGLIMVALALALALAIVVLVFVRERSATRRIEQVARAARAVADGDLNQRLEVDGHARTRAIAESFNLMIDRLREHIRREAENRQFQAFMRLSAMLTHDLKNAITGLSMLVANMERQFHREEFRADAIAGLRDATDNLRSIVSRLSEPVKTLSGEYRTSLRSVDLVPVVRRVVEMTTAPAQPLHRIELDLPATLIATVDVERIERVIENLVLNALEAMGARPGTLSVSAGPVGDDQFFIAVADTGSGMSEEFIRTKLFRPFATTKKQGLGLGLYTCREIVEAHGGRIEVESQPNVGTRFRVVLPSSPKTLLRS